MSSNKKTPSDLTANWDGRDGSFMHVHRLGNSQRISVKQIVDAAIAAMPAPESPDTPEAPAGLETGSIIQMPVGNYADYLECDGSIQASSVAPDLAAKIAGTGTKYSGVLPSDTARKALTTGEILDAVYFKGLLFVLSTAAPQLTAYDASFNLVFQASFAFGYKRFTVTDNALYFVNTSYNIYYAQVNGTTVTVNYAGQSTQSSNGGFSAISVSSTEDLFCWMSLRRLFNVAANTLRGVTGSFSIAGNDQGSSIVKASNGRIFFVGTYQGANPGLYELFLDVPNGAVTAAKQLKAIYLAPDTIYCSGKTVYFGVGGIQHRFDTETDRIESVLTPSFVNSSAATHSVYCKDNLLFIQGLKATTGNYGYMSFDKGTTFQKLPAFNNRLNGMLIDSNHKALYFGDTGTVGSVDASSGNAEIHQLSLLDGSFFKIPLLTGAAEGYRFYVRK